jgi:glycosyltransferase involved in cell wall biosynthesis
MRAGLNAAIELHGFSGSARGLQHIRRALTEAEGVEPVVVAPKVRFSDRALLRRLELTRWDFVGAARATGTTDLHISPGNVGASPGRPHLLWLHDVMVLDRPEWFAPSFSRYARMAFPGSVRSARAIAVPSQDSALRMTRRWPNAPEPTVIPWPAEARARSPRVDVPDPPTALIVGETNPRKNHLEAIDAIRMTRIATGADIRLEILGRPGTTEDLVMASCRAADPDGSWIRRRTEVGDDALDEAYASAWVLLHPALHEGFGLPPLEAAAHATPSVHSGQGALAEVCPSGNVKATNAGAFVPALVALLDPDCFRRRSAEALAEIAPESTTRFREALVDLCRSLVR